MTKIDYFFIVVYSILFVEGFILFQPFKLALFLWSNSIIVKFFNIIF
jgi:hypothetical protein